MTRKLFDEATEREIAKKYSDGTSYSALLREYGASISAISRAVKVQGGVNRGYARKREEFTVEELNDIADRWLNQLQSRNRIATDYGSHAEAIIKALILCGIDPGERRYATGEDHGNWNGGRWVEPNGYVFRRISPSHPFYCMSYDGRILEHRLIMAEYLGRPLEPYETVHHIDNDSLNNDLSNLQLRIGNHGKGAAFRCRTCGSHDLIAAPLSG